MPYNCNPNGKLYNNYKANIGTYRECRSWCVLYECVKSYEYLAQDDTYYHDSSFGFMIKVKA